MGLNWNEIKSRALLFSKTWADACNENSQAKPFWIDFFEIFGITDKRVGTFEQHVKKLSGQRGFMDLFWPGVLLVEHKSRGESLDKALEQAIGYLHHQPERNLPQLVVVCDFARFRVRRLATGETIEFELEGVPNFVYTAKGSIRTTARAPTAWAKRWTVRMDGVPLQLSMRATTLWVVPMRAATSPWVRPACVRAAISSRASSNSGACAS